MLAVPSLKEVCRCMASETGSVRGGSGPAAGAGDGVQPASSGRPSPATTPAPSTARRLTRASVPIPPPGYDGARPRAVARTRLAEGPDNAGMSRALVLGGGGVTGVAWEIGVLAGLAEAGVDLTGADLVVGTSAGSVVGAQVTSGAGIEELYARQLEPPASERVARLGRAAQARYAWAM